MKRRPIDPRPPRRANARAGLWLGWATAAVAVLGTSSFLLSTAVTFPDHRHYQGYFEPTTRKQAIVMPADVPLAAVLVREGEDVVQGQRIALFDQVMLEAQIKRLKRALFVNELERACLLQTEQTGRVAPAAMDPEYLSVEEQSALARCELTHREDAVARENLHRQRNTLVRQIELQSREAKERLRMADPNVRHVLSLRVAIDQNALKAALASLDLAIASEVIQQERKTLETVAELERQASKINDALAVLTSHLADPYLAAPETGRVTRVRALPLHEPFSGETDLLHLVSEQKSTYAATIQVPSQEADLWEKGSSVLVRFSALPSSAPGFPANLHGIRRIVTTDGKAMAEIEISLDFSGQQSKLTHQSIETMLSGSGRSSITATLPRTSLKQSLQPAINRLGTYF